MMNREDGAKNNQKPCSDACQYVIVVVKYQSVSPTRQVRMIRQELQIALAENLQAVISRLALELLKRLLVHLQLRAKPGTNLDLLGYFVHLAYGKTLLTRRRLKQALTIALEAMVQLLESLIEAKCQSPIPIDDQYCQRSETELRQIFNFFQAYADPTEVYKWLQYYRKLQSTKQGRFLARVFAEHIIGQRSFEDIADLHEMTVASIRRYWLQAQCQIQEMLCGWKCMI